MQRINLLSSLMLVAMISVIVAGSATANTDDVRPVFNHKTEIPFVVDDNGSTENRDEADFLRFGLRGELGNGDDVDFCSDQTVDVWFYIHNGTAAVNNNTSGNSDDTDFDGPAVAHDTTVRLDVPAEAGNQHLVTASITSDASDDVADSVQINCSDETKQVSLTYLEAETLLSTRAPAHASLGGFNLRGNLADQGGAVLGYGTDGQGIVPGCWDYSAVIRGKLQIVVSDETPVEEPGEETPEEPEDTPEDEPEDIPALGPGGAAPLAAVALSSVLGAVSYRAVQSRR